MRHYWLAIAMSALLGWMSPLLAHADDAEGEKPRAEQKDEAKKDETKKDHAKKHRGHAKRGGQSHAQHRRGPHARSGSDERRSVHASRPRHHRGESAARGRQKGKHGDLAHAQRGPHQVKGGHHRSSFSRQHVWSNPRNMWSGQGRQHSGFHSPRGPQAFAHRGFGPQHGSHAFAHHGFGPAHGHQAHRGHDSHPQWAHRGPMHGPATHGRSAFADRGPHGPRPGMQMHYAPQHHGPPQHHPHSGFGKGRSGIDHGFRNAAWQRGPHGPWQHNRDGDRQDRDDRSRGTGRREHTRERDSH